MIPAPQARILQIAGPVLVRFLPHRDRESRRRAFLPTAVEKPVCETRLFQRSQ